MNLTGQMIVAGGYASVSAIGLISLFLLKRGWNVFTDLEGLKEEFEGLHESIEEEISEEKQDLFNLSLSHRSLMKQLERKGDIDRELLRTSLKKAEEKKNMFSSERTHHLYFAAWARFREIREEIGQKV